MKSDCIAFTAIPHTTELFKDFLYHFERVHQFYPLNPRERDGLRAPSFDEGRRRRVAEILERQNHAFGASNATIKNIERLRAGASASVTGQQVGLFGGPLYAILKAASAIRLARDLTAKGSDCVPVFWLATEDHDLAEVNHITLLDPEGMPQRLETTSHGDKDAPVSEVKLGNEIVPVVERACGLLGDSELPAALRESYRPGESLGTAFAKLFAKLFGDFGLILLDPSDREFHELAKPIYAAAIEKSGFLTAALLQRGRELRDAGYHEQVKVTPETTLLFEKRNGARTPIHRVNAKLKSPAYSSHVGERDLLEKIMVRSEEPEGEPSSFRIGRDEVSREQLRERVEAEPHRFSANVLLRPVVQDFLLPTVAYFGGAAEVAYFAQVAVVYEELLGRTTPILPRFSATLLDPRAQRLMKKYEISLPDLFDGPESTRELLGSRSLPPGLHGQFGEAGETVSGVMDGLKKSLQTLDPTLKDAAERSQRKILYQLERLKKRATLAELRRNEEVVRHAAWLSANLYPDKGLQEREIAAISYVARGGRDLLEKVVECAGDCPDHQVIHL